MSRLPKFFCLAFVSATLLQAPAVAAPVVDGKARFEVLSPTLIRLEFAPDGRFEDRETQTTFGRLRGREPRFTTAIRGGQRVIRTSKLTLRWRRDANGFGDGALTATLGRRKLTPKLGPNPQPLGGWRRSLDLVDGPVPLHEGMLSRAGWYLLDDSKTAVIEGDRPVERAAPDGYQDLYLFAYGSDYAHGLRDLRTLTGPAPLLPRKAFGVWFSRYWPYSAGDWQTLLAKFRTERVPLDTISLDTDFKRVNDAAGSAIATTVAGAPAGAPYSWNGWDWNADLFPDPQRFFAWAHDSGLEVGLNVHPSIDSADPRFADTNARAGGALKADDGCRVTQADPKGQCMVFDWTDPKQLDAYFALHEPFERQGMDFWWLDWCCDASSAELPGLTPDTWISKQYFDRQRARGSRWPSFQRIGGSHQLGFGGNGGTGAFAEHRTSLQFTGDTCASWPLLAFASEFTASAASIGMPYVSHDIGTFHAVSPTGVCDKTASPLLTPRANELPPDMYARWVQFGAFQPLERLHSHHGKRLPWEYDGKPGTVAADFLRLRESLVPTLYSLAREAVDTGVPMVRPLWLGWPKRDEAYEHPSQYTLGRDVLVAPVAAPGDPAKATVWFPPGTWVDWFTGERHRGPATKELTVPLERMPVFVRAGGIVATQPPVATTPAGPPRELVLLAHAGRGATTVYDDDGRTLDYTRAQYARTRITQRRRHGATTLTIGRLRGAPVVRRRHWTIRLIGVAKPQRATLGGRRLPVRYDAASRTATIRTGTLPAARAATVVVR